MSQLQEVVTLGLESWWILASGHLVNFVVTILIVSVVLALYFLVVEGFGSLLFWLKEK